MKEIISFEKTANEKKVIEYDNAVNTNEFVAFSPSYFGNAPDMFPASGPQAS
jgi:hypothetical protein